MFMETNEIDNLKRLLTSEYEENMKLGVYFLKTVFETKEAVKNFLLQTIYPDLLKNDINVLFEKSKKIKNGYTKLSFGVLKGVIDNKETSHIKSLKDVNRAYFCFFHNLSYSDKTTESGLLLPILTRIFCEINNEE